MNRTATVRRTTGETDVEVRIDLDGTGVADASTGVGFFDHMLVLLARHSLIDVTVTARGDLETGPGRPSPMRDFTVRKLPRGNRLKDPKPLNNCDL